MDRLPPELWGKVVKNLFAGLLFPGLYDSKTLYSNDEVEFKRDLFACSQVSRQFRLTTLPYLFHTLALWVEDTEGDGGCPGQGSCHCRIGPLREFLKESAAVRDNVKEVRVRGRASSGKGSVLNGFELVTVLYLLPKLESLAMFNVLCAPLSHMNNAEDFLDGDHLALQRFFYIIRGVHYELSPMQLSAFLLSFSSIRLAVISGPTFVTIPVPQLPTPPPPGRSGNSKCFILCLRLLHCRGQSELFASFGRIDVRNLEALSAVTDYEGVVVPDDWQAPEIDTSGRRQLDRHAFCLRNFGLDMSHRWTYEVLGLPPGESLSYNLASLGLDRCRRIRHVELKWVYCDRSASDAVCLLLSSLCGLPDLRRVTLVLNILEKTPDETLAFLDEGRDLYSAVENAIIQLRRVEKVQVKMMNAKGDRVDWQPAFIRSYGHGLFPLLHIKGTLSWSSTYVGIARC